MNWDAIKTLLEVVHSAAAAGPKYAKIASAAEAELWAEFAPPEVEVGDEDENDSPATTPARRL